MKTGKIRINEIYSSYQIRIKPNGYLIEGKRTIAQLKEKGAFNGVLGDFVDSVFRPGIFKRIFVTSPEFGLPYITAQGMMNSEPLKTAKLLSIKHTKDLDSMILKHHYLLVSCAGSIGNIRHIDKEIDGKVGSQDIIRVVPKDYYGFIYAYLSTPTIYSYLQSQLYGSVVTRIEPEVVSSIPMPVFSDKFKCEINSIVEESVRDREKAADALTNAHSIIDQKFDVANEKKPPFVSIQSILSSHNKRFEASYHTSANRSVYDYITSNFEYKTLGELTSRIFRPGIFKREYVANGVTFLGGADILMAIPDSDKKLSFRQVEKMPELKVQKNWILVTCGGTIGNTVLIDSQLEKCVVSQHVMRVVPKDDILKGYLYAILSSKIGHELITMFTTGSVIPQIEAHHLELVPIPLLDKETMKHIDDLVSTYVSKIEVSKEKELKAIKMVEEEIEKWNN